MYFKRKWEDFGINGVDTQLIIKEDGNLKIDIFIILRIN